MMYEQIYAFALFIMTFLSPEPARLPEHEIMSRAFATVVTQEDPLFKNDEDKLRTTSVLLAVAFREGSLRPRIEGDCSESNPGEKCKGRPRSFCTFQIHQTMGGGPALNEDPTLCVRTAMKIMRTSVRVCPRYPIAWYAVGGEHACANARGQRISNDRLGLSKRLYSKRELAVDSRQLGESRQPTAHSQQ